MTNTKGNSLVNCNKTTGVNFYKHILKHKNPTNKPYPIIRLIGHRGSASQIVRSIAKTANDLKNFLRSNPDVFIVTGDNVILSKKYSPKAVKTSKLPDLVSASNTSLGKNVGTFKDATKPQNNKVVNDLVKNNNNKETRKEPVDLLDAVEFYFTTLFIKSGLAAFPLVRLIGHRASACSEIQKVAKNPEGLKGLLIQFPTLFAVSRRKVKISTHAATILCSLTYYLTKLLESSQNGEKSFEELFKSCINAPLDVQLAINSAHKLKELVSRFNEYFVVRGNCLCLKPELYSSLRDEPSNLHIIRLISKAIVRKEVKHSDLPSPQTTISSTNLVKKFEQKTIVNPNAPLLCDRLNLDISNKAQSPVQFFLDKLWMNGLCRVMSISDLFKFKSQATPEVQAVCGKNIQEFREFLSLHKESFIITLENVLARRNMPRKKWNPALRGIEEPICSVLVNFFKTYTEHGRPEHINRLYSQVGKCFFGNDGRLFFESSKELEDFLNMFPQFFYTYGGQVVNILHHNNACLKSTPLKGSTGAKMDSLKSNENKAKNISSVDLENGKCWKQDVLKMTMMVNSLQQCQDVVKQILKEDKVIALDCEGLNLGAHGFLSLIQIAKQNGKVFVFDILQNPDYIYLLKDILESRNILKVMHDCRNDAANLYHEFEISLSNIFDTRVAHSVISNSTTTKGYKTIAFNKLCNIYGAPINIQKDEFKDVYKLNPGFWLERPLNDEMLAYAALDVACLVPHVYNSMRQKAGDLEPRILELSEIYAKSCI